HAAADEQDPNSCPTGSAVCVSPGEIDPPLQGSDSPAHAAQRSGEHSGVDKTGEPRCAWLGPPLQAGPRPKALPPTRRLVDAANLVAPVRQMALLQLGNVATQQALRRVWARQSCRADPFHRHSEESVFVKAGCGKTARPVWAADGGQRESSARASSARTAAKPANKAEQSAAEPVEPRAGTKGNASQQSTCRTQSRVSVSQALEHIRRIARERKKERFTALFHHLNIDLLEEAFFELKEDAAPGVDRLTWTDYEADLKRTLENLHGRVQRGAYRALPSRRVYIPKPDGGQRPLAVAALEDKIVQRAVLALLNAIYEEDFLGISYGFRP